jgi:hypothetical protein
VARGGNVAAAATAALGNIPSLALTDATSSIV